MFVNLPEEVDCLVLFIRRSFFYLPYSVSLPRLTAAI